jgi:microsomal epoxide hydrolase
MLFRCFSCMDGRVLGSPHFQKPPLLISSGSILEFVPLLSLFRTQYTPQDLPFHIIVPALPGYAFSSPPPLDRNFTMLEVADMLNSLMLELGFGATGYVAQGGDIGSRLARLLGAKHDACKAVHCE